MQLTVSKIENEIKAPSKLRALEEVMRRDVPSRVGALDLARLETRPVNQQLRGAKRACRPHTFMQLIVGRNTAFSQQHIHTTENS